MDPATGEVIVTKVPSTPPEFERGVAAALDAAAERFRARPAGRSEHFRGAASPARPAPSSGDIAEPVAAREIERFVHGTTVVINALTERKGARTALVTTRGFRDVLEIGRANRPDLYNMLYEKPKPFVPRRWRLEVRGRVDALGRVVEPLADEDVVAAAEFCRAEGIEAVAVALINAYANPELEQACARRLRELLPGVHVTAATDISRQWREYERSNTAVFNAFVQPVVARYVERLGDALDARRVPAGSRYLMQSGGGTMDFADARRVPIHLVESGPVAGVIGAAYVGRTIGEPRLVALDIGGTTAKASLVEDGRPRVVDEYAIERRPDWAGYPLQVPTIDIVEVGAGGGSIAWADETGAMYVGPESAGAVPGPACYGCGGRRPTVTDANLVAGRIDGDRFLGGRMRLDRRAAEAALAELGAPHGLDAAATARGILRLAHARMGHAIEMVSLRRGHDPRDFTLLAYGGGGPVHGAALARELRLKRVLIPRYPGVFSAWGMLAADLRRSWSRTLPGRVPIPAVGEDAAQVASAAGGSSPAGRSERSRGAASPTADGESHEIAWRRWAEAIAAMENEARAWLRAQGLAPDDMRIEHAVDMRYAGQEHTVRVPLPATAGGEGLAVTPELFAQAAADFHALHERAYTFRLDNPVEVVHLHVTAVGRLDRPPLDRWTGGVARPEPTGRRLVDWDEGGVVETPVYERRDLLAGWEARGPVVIEEDESTTLVLPGQRVAIDDFGHILIEEEGA